MKYPRIERGVPRRIYWQASASASASTLQPPFSRAPAPAAVLDADASYCGIGDTFARVVATVLMAAASRCSIRCSAV